MATQNTEDRSVKTTETVFGIVEILRDEDKLTLTELATRLEMPRSTLHAHLTTLVDQGYLIKSGNQYRLSLKFLDIGARARERNELYQKSGPTLEQVAQQTKEIVWLVVEENGKGICLRNAEGELAIQPYKKIGGRITLHDTAAGKSILANLPESRVREILDETGLPARTVNTITDEDRLFDELDEIRERGVAFNDSESMERFRAVASPICPNDDLCGAIVVSGPKNRLRNERFRNELPEVIMGASNALELELISTE